jgi:AcrR family transcriptional regulator
MKKNNAQSDISEALSVPERVRSALVLFQRESGRRLSVNGVCRAAGVNRAGLYAHHPNLVEEILTLSRSTPIAPSVDRRRADREDLRKAADRLKEIDARYRALLVVCIEQQAEISALQARLRTRQETDNIKSGRRNK